MNTGHGTWLELARELAHQLEIEDRVVPVQLKDMRFKAERPPYCALSNEKLASLGIVMPSWQDAVARYLSSANAVCS